MIEEQPINQEQKQIHTKLHIGLLQRINLALYPKERTHYLALALQQGFKPPSVSSMNRSEVRNSMKSGASQAAAALRGDTGLFGSTGVTVPRVYRKKGTVKFRVPARFGAKPFKRVSQFVNPGQRGRGGPRGRGIRGRGARGRARGQEREVHAPKPAQYRKGRAIPGRTPISLPVQINRKVRQNQGPKAKSSAFIIRSPQWRILKAQRDSFREQIQKYRLEHPGKNTQQKGSVPEYFRKRKANQKRRRQQKHQLVKANRKALEQIFGDAIYQKGWPISRREIKLALGIKEEEFDKEVSVAEFNAMAQQEFNRKKSQEMKPE